MTSILALILYGVLSVIGIAGAVAVFIVAGGDYWKRNSGR